MQNIRYHVWVGVALLSLASPTLSFSSGASHASCQEMIPSHIRAQPLDPQHSHVTLRTSAASYLPGQLVTVTVRSSRDFMGFLLQARSVHSTGVKAQTGFEDEVRSVKLGPVLVGGSWALTPPGTHTLRCLSEDDTLTHSDKQLKRNLSFVWKAPDAPMGDIRFCITVVQSYFIYWAGIESAVMHDGSHGPWSESDIIGLNKWNPVFASQEDDTAQPDTRPTNNTTRPSTYPSPPTVRLKGRRWLKTQEKPTDVPLTVLDRNVNMASPGDYLETGSNESNKPMMFLTKVTTVSEMDTYTTLRPLSGVPKEASTDRGSLLTYTKDYKSPHVSHDNLSYPTSSTLIEARGLEGSTTWSGMTVTDSDYFPRTKDEEIGRNKVKLNFLDLNLPTVPETKNSTFNSETTITGTLTTGPRFHSTNPSVSTLKNPRPTIQSQTSLLKTQGASFQPGQTDPTEPKRRLINVDMFSSNQAFLQIQNSPPKPLLHLRNDSNQTLTISQGSSSTPFPKVEPSSPPSNLLTLPSNTTPSSLKQRHPQPLQVLHNKFLNASPHNHPGTKDQSVNSPSETKTKLVPPQPQPSYRFPHLYQSQKATSQTIPFLHESLSTPSPKIETSSPSSKLSANLSFSNQNQPQSIQVLLNKLLNVSPQNQSETRHEPEDRPSETEYRQGPPQPGHSNGFPYTDQSKTVTSQSFTFLLASSSTHFPNVETSSPPSKLPTPQSFFHYHTTPSVSQSRLSLLVLLNKLLNDPPHEQSGIKDQPEDSLSEPITKNRQTSPAQPQPFNSFPQTIQTQTGFPHTDKPQTTTSWTVPFFKANSTKVNKVLNAPPHNQSGTMNQSEHSPSESQTTQMQTTTTQTPPFNGFPDRDQSQTATSWAIPPLQASSTPFPNDKFSSPRSNPPTFQSFFQSQTTLNQSHPQSLQGFFYKFLNASPDNPSGTNHQPEDSPSKFTTRQRQTSALQPGLKSFPQTIKTPYILRKTSSTSPQSWSQDHTQTAPPQANTVEMRQIQATVTLQSVISLLLPSRFEPIFKPGQGQKVRDLQAQAKINTTSPIVARIPSLSPTYGQPRTYPALSALLSPSPISIPPQVPTVHPSPHSPLQSSFNSSKKSSSDPFTSSASSYTISLSIYSTSANSASLPPRFPSSISSLVSFQSTSRYPEPSPVPRRSLYHARTSSPVLSQKLDLGQRLFIQNQMTSSDPDPNLIILTPSTVVHVNVEPHPNIDPDFKLSPDRKTKPNILNSDAKPKGPSIPSGAPDNKEKYPDIIPRHSTWELGMLLGSSAGLGMILVMGVRYLYRQACGKRTEVTLNDQEREYGRAERGLIHVQECGDLVRVRRIRENSFVLLAEYNILASPGD